MGIYGKIIDLQKLGMAWDHVKKNKPAAGVDEVTYEDFENRRKEELHQLNLELAEHRYESLPVRQVNLYKGEKVRVISIFSMRDKVVQQSLATELGKIYEPLFSSSAYAYRPGQSALQALGRIEEQVLGSKGLWVLKMDISGFFDHIDHTILLRKLNAQIREEDVLDLVRQILKARILDERTGVLTENATGIFQGATCAPILSNIYLMDFDKEMEARSGFYIRFSDDILVLEPEEAKARELLAFAQVYLEKEGLQLKESKTTLHRVSESEGFEYLGYAFNTQGKTIPQKAVESLTTRLETMWLTSGMPMEDKLKKCQEILGGWEQYFRGEREPDSIIEYLTVLSMVRNKSEEIRSAIEKRRFAQTNYYRDVLEYMVGYWKYSGCTGYALWEYEQFFHVPVKGEPDAGVKNQKLAAELLEAYKDLLEAPDDEVYANIIQIYTDLEDYQKASYFWEQKNEFARQHKNRPQPSADDVSHTPAGMPQVDLGDYSALFVGREDTYVSETMQEGGRRVSRQVFEPLTEKGLKKHLAAEEILGTYVQRPNATAKYLVLDVDISKKVLLQHPYGTQEFVNYKKRALGCAMQMQKTLRQMGIRSYLEDTGFRGYHVWAFFTEWIPVRYINQLTDAVRKKLAEDLSGEEHPLDTADIAVEFFPNSARVRQGKCGQCIKLPLGVHIRSGERSFFLDDDLQPVADYREFLSGIAKLSLAAVRKILGLYLKPEADSLAQANVVQRTAVELDMDKLGLVPEPIRIVLEHCTLMRYLCQKAISTGYLTHFERQSVLYVFGHMGEAGKEFVHKVMSFTMNYQYHVTQKFILKIPDKPISCLKLRDQYKMVTAEYGCSCNFKQTKNCYPSPVLHALKNSGEAQADITVPTSRSLSKAKEEEVYEEINIHKQTQKFAQRIVELKKQRRGLDKSIRKNEQELQRIFDNAGIDCLEIEMGMLVRRKTDKGYEWLIEI